MTWDAIKNHARIPADSTALDAFFVAEAAQRDAISARRRPTWATQAMMHSTAPKQILRYAPNDTL